MRTTDARRVLSADRRGSSWPVLVETSDGLRFTKLRGAAQGTAPLVAEVIVAALAEMLGLNVPARTIVRIEPDVPSADRHDELRDLLNRSVGENLGFAYLDGGAMIDAGAADARAVDSISSDDAASIVWLDALVMNPDRGAHNSNMMRWHDRVWLIDHGAALGFQYAWDQVTEDSPRAPWRPPHLHVLASRVADLDSWDEILAPRLTRDVIQAAVDDVPDSFLLPLVGAMRDLETLRRRRAAYVAFLWKRLAAPRGFFRGLSNAAQPAPRDRRVPDWLTRPARG